MGSGRISSAIMDHGPVWPEYWNKEELEKVKSNAYQLVNGMHSGCKDPTSEEGALNKT